MASGYNTLLHFKNITGNEQELLFQIHYQGGVYNPGLKRLEPHQNLEVDLGRLQREQTPDESGTALPAEALGGQVLWSVHYTGSMAEAGGSSRGVTLIGRA